MLFDKINIFLVIYDFIPKYASCLHHIQNCFRNVYLSSVSQVSREMHNISEENKVYFLKHDAVSPLVRLLIVLVKFLDLILINSILNYPKDKKSVLILTG